MTGTGLFEKWTQMRSDFEQGVRAIVGERIVRVRYFDLPHIEWNFYPDYDAPPMGLELEMASGRFFYATWDSTFDQFSILLEEGRMVGNGVGEGAIVEIIDVTERSRWVSVLGDGITRASIFWGEAAYPDPPMVPQDVELAFESGRHIYIGSREPIRNGDALCGSMDHVVIVFDDETARRYGVGPYDKVRFDESQWHDKEGNWRVPKWAR